MYSSHISGVAARHTSLADCLGPDAATSAYDTENKANESVKFASHDREMGVDRSPGGHAQLLALSTYFCEW